MLQRYLFTAIISINRVNFTKMKKNSYHIIGVMSGTSLDGIDLAELFFFFSEDNRWNFKIEATATIAYPSVWKQKLEKAVSSTETELILLNEDYTDYLSEAINRFINKNSLQNIDAVSSHGHTILHQPEAGITLQIGNLEKLAKQIQQTVVCDFRVQDVALGGQGAPLVPIGDKLLFADYDYCLNLGGFANVSTQHEEQVIAYDICPVNIVMNKYAEELGLAFDRNGELAKIGNLNSSLLQQLNDLNFYTETPPKSLGLEWVNEKIIPLMEDAELTPHDKLRTFVEHIAVQIVSQIKKNSTVLVTGGGAYNNYLISRIKDFGDFGLIIPSEEIIEYKEAIIFGLLGVLRLRDQVNCLASVTGAKQDHSSGVIFKKNEY